MKTPDPAEVVRGEQEAMKSENPSPRKTAAGRGKSSVGIRHLPMEWMDPMSWRLPSGKALAEFALQTGFLAPLIFKVEGIRTPRPFQDAPKQMRKAVDRGR